MRGARRFSFDSWRRDRAVLCQLGLETPGAALGATWHSMKGASNDEREVFEGLNLEGMPIHQAADVFRFLRKGGNVAGRENLAGRSKPSPA